MRQADAQEYEREVSDLEMLNQPSLDPTPAADQIYKKDMDIRWISPETKSECLFNPSVCDTFLQLKDSSVVLVPWRVFHKRPDFLHSAFHYDHGQIVYSDDVNVMMDAPMLKASSLGHLDEFTQTWEVKVKTEEELDVLLIRLASFPSVLSATLMKRNVLGANSEIPAVLFLDPSSGCIQELARKLGQSRETFKGGKRFSVEVDLGPSVEMWSKTVLRRDFLCVGARFCVTNGSTFNHMWDMTNVLGCLPCLICGLIGTSVYRTNRKLKYMDISQSGLENVVIIGTTTEKAVSQRFAIYNLMKWIHSVPSPICENCNHSFSKSPTDVKCSVYHVTFQEQQHIKDKSTMFTPSSEITSHEDEHKVNEDCEGKEKENSAEFLSVNSAETTTNVLSNSKNESKKNKEKEAEATKARERRMFLFPYYEESDKYYEKDKNYPLATGDKTYFIKSKKKMFQNRDFENTENNDILLGPLKDSPYNESNVTSIKRLNEGELQELQLSIWKDEEMIKKRNAPPPQVTNGHVSCIVDDRKLSTEVDIFDKKPTVLCEDKQFIDTSRHATDEVFPTSINVVYEEPEFEEDVPVPHGSTQDDYTCEFFPHHTPDGHAFILPEKPSDAFFNEYDPLSHVDVLNFLACKSKKTKAAEPNDTEKQSKGKRNHPIKSQPRRKNAKKRGIN